MPLFIVPIASQRGNKHTDICSWAHGYNPLQSGIQLVAELFLLQQDRPSLAATFLTVPSSPGCAFPMPPRGIFEDQSQLFSWQIFSTSFVPVRNLLRTLLSPSNLFFLFWGGTAEMRKRRCGGNSLIAIHRNSDSTHPKASLAWTEQAELLREAEHTVFVEWAGISYCARQTKIPWSFYFIVFSGCTAKSPGKMPSPTATGFHCLFLLVSACCQIPQGSNFYPFSYVVSILPQPHCFSLGHCL